MKKDATLNLLLLYYGVPRLVHDPSVFTPLLNLLVQCHLFACSHCRRERVTKTTQAAILLIMYTNIFLARFSSQNVLTRVCPLGRFFVFVCGVDHVEDAHAYYAAVALLPAVATGVPSIHSTPCASNRTTHDLTSFATLVLICALHSPYSPPACPP